MASRDNKIINRIKAVLAEHLRTIYVANGEMLRMYWDICELLPRSQNPPITQPVVAQLYNNAEMNTDAFTKSVISQLPK